MGNPQSNAHGFDIGELERLAGIGGASADEHITTWDPAQPDRAPPQPEDPWPEPEPLTTRIEPEFYPEDALPLRISAAVQEILGFVKAPLPLIVSSALSAVSLACQGHVDVK